ncbi:MAG: stage III sporulation protein AA [Clostridia bacterium]|nr:stage III sporulation protein AA [Clostridia bacterium]
MKILEKSKGEIFSKILPAHIYSATIENINYSQLNEIRLRVEKPIIVYLGGQAYFLSENGITNNIGSSIICKKEDIESIVFRSSECSIYAVNEQIKKGFLTISGGIRIGLSGTAVCENYEVKTIKNFNSLVIRIPHKVKNCSLMAFKYILEDNRLHNTLIISPPGAGKTTFLRDFISQLSQRNICFNVLVLDERGELAAINESGESILESNFTDILSFISKADGFLLGIRALNPNLIVCDEIGAEEDVKAIEYACSCGVSVIASVHAGSIAELKQKPNFNTLLSKKLFDRYVVLSSREGPGTCEGIFDSNFTRLTN